MSRRNRTTEKYYISETTGNICESAQTLPGDCGDSFSGTESTNQDQLAECNFGEFENKNYKELSDDPRYQAWIDSNGIMAFPGGESKEECAARNLEGFQRAVTTCIRENISEAALVVHGGTIMNIMEAYALPKKEFYEWHVGNGCGYLVELEPALWKKDRRVLQVLETRNKQ